MYSLTPTYTYHSFSYTYTYLQSLTLTLTYINISLLFFSLNRRKFSAKPFVNVKRGKFTKEISCWETGSYEPYYNLLPVDTYKMPIVICEIRYLHDEIMNRLFLKEDTLNLGHNIDSSEQWIHLLMRLFRHFVVLS